MPHIDDEYTPSALDHNVKPCLDFHTWKGESNANFIHVKQLEICSPWIVKKGIQLKRNNYNLEVLKMTLLSQYNKKDNIMMIIMTITMINDNDDGKENHIWSQISLWGYNQSTAQCWIINSP